MLQNISGKLLVGQAALGLGDEPYFPLLVLWTLFGRFESIT